MSGSPPSIRTSVNDSSSILALDPRVSLDPEIAELVPADETEAIRVHQALEELSLVSDRLTRVVEMRYFAGMTEPEIAETLGVTERTVRRDWEKARMLLATALK